MVGPSGTYATNNHCASTVMFVSYNSSARAGTGLTGGDMSSRRRLSLASRRLLALELHDAHERRKKFGIAEPAEVRWERRMRYQDFVADTLPLLSPANPRERPAQASGQKRGRRPERMIC